jgi:hydrogenase maturation protease
MARILIIGWGNPLRGDDGLGWRAAGQLAEALQEPEVTVRVSHQLLPEFAEELRRFDLVIFIDASCDNGASGQVRFERVEPSRSPSAAFTHQMDPPGLLAMAERLYGACPKAVLFSVAGSSFGYGEGLSPEVQSAMPELLARIRKICSTFATPNGFEES